MAPHGAKGVFSFAKENTPFESPKRKAGASYSQCLLGAGFHFVQAIVDRLLGRPLKRVFHFLRCDLIHHLVVCLLLTYVLSYR